MQYQLRKTIKIVTTALLINVAILPVIAQPHHQQYQSYSESKEHQNHFGVTSIINVGLIPVIAQQPHQEHKGHDMPVPTTNVQTLPPVPNNLPGWMDNKDTNHI